MARPEAQALGGYYKTPTHITPMIARLINTEPAHQKDKHHRYGKYLMVDPCAGKGEALADLAVALFPDGQYTYDHQGPQYDLYACELEKDRAAALEQRFRTSRRLHYNHAVQGDAFRLNWDDKAEASILYLNPPYDTDPDYKRMEQRFLERFAPILDPGTGILLYVVPYYVVGVGATYLATHFRQLKCYRFPEPDFQDFKQVVLVGRRRKQPAAFSKEDSPEANRLRAWAQNPDTIPVLGQHAGVIDLIPKKGGDARFWTWKVEKIDMTAVYSMSRPWMKGRGSKLTNIRGIGLDDDLTDLIGARFPVIMPPRPAHVAIALASGLVNGRRVTPDKPESNLPTIMVKGVFQKEFTTVDEKRNKDGDVVAQIMVEQPQLHVTILDMDRWTYYDLEPGTTPTGSMDVAEMNIADLLKHYGLSLARLMHRQCPPLHDPSDVGIELPEFGLRPYTAQYHAIQAALKALFTDIAPFAGENPFVLGEVGTGKTLIALCVADCMTPKHFRTTRQRLAEVGVKGGKARPVRRLLVMCPPHLLKSWADEAKKIIPLARTKVLKRISDVEEAIAEAKEADLQEIVTDKDEIRFHDLRPGAGLTIYIISREMAKLGHKWVAGTHKLRCPICGAVNRTSKSTLVSQRVRCDKTHLLPMNWYARKAMELAILLNTVDPTNENVDSLIRSRIMRKQNLNARKRYGRNRNEQGKEDTDAMRQREWQHRATNGQPDAGTTRAWRLTPIGKLAAEVHGKILDLCEGENYESAKELMPLLNRVFMVLDHPQRDHFILGYAEEIYEATLKNMDRYGSAADLRDKVQELLLLVKDTSGQAQMALINKLKNIKNGRQSINYRSWFDVDKALRRMRYEREGQEAKDLWAMMNVSAKNGTIQYGGSYSSKAMVLGTPEAATKLLAYLVGKGNFSESAKCGAPLYAAVPEPRRYPLATYICRHHPDLFDMLVLDEAHEYSTDGSAQERAAHRLTELGKPTLILTGTSNNGYASSLFMNMWALSRRFRHEFDRGEIQGFVTRYGYRKVRAEPDDMSFRSTYGVHSDRVDTKINLKMHKIGEAPGVLPLFILKHLLTVAVPIHKSDLDVELPPLVEYAADVEADGEHGKKLVKEYKSLRQQLIEQIMEDLREAPKELGGKLWGQMAQIPTYLDRAHEDTGNRAYLDQDGNEAGRLYKITYPPSVGGGTVATAKPFPASVIMPKERWLIDTVRAELAENRYCLVFVTNSRSGLPERLYRLLKEEIGNKIAILNPRVKAARRQEWIDRQVIGKGMKVMIANPKAVETGLNNLTYFCTSIWMQNPGCSAIIYRQANGRTHRPGQEADEVRVYVPYYTDTTQEAQFTLLGHKIAASQQTDGLDVTSALIAAGADDESTGLDTMAVGQAIYRLLIEGNGHKENMNGHFAQAPARRKATSPPPPVVEDKEPAADGSQQLSLFGGWSWEDRPAEGDQMKLLEKKADYYVHMMRGK